MKNIWNQIENMYFVLPFTFFKLYQLPLTIILLIHIIIQIHIKLYILIVRKQNFWFIFYPSYDFIIVNQWSICWFVINTFFCPYPTRGEFSVIFHLFIFYFFFQSWTPLPPPTTYHLSRSSPCTSPKHPVSCIEHRLAIRFSHDWKPELKETRVPQCSSQYCLFHFFSNWSICKNYLELFYTSDLSILPHFSFTLSFNFISIVS